MQEWAEVHDSPLHEVSTDGQIRNTETGHILAQTTTRDGTRKVTFRIDGAVTTRSVKVLVAEAFVERPYEAYDTPILLDGDKDNVTVENIIWRPRWFAMRWQRQFDPIAPKYYTPCVDAETGEEFMYIVSAGMYYGSLFDEIYQSCMDRSPVFPGMRRFHFPGLERWFA